MATMKKVTVPLCAVCTKSKDKGRHTPASKGDGSHKFVAGPHKGFERVSK